MNITFNPGQASSLGVYRQHAERLGENRQERTQRGQEPLENGDTIKVSQDALLLTEARRSAQSAPDVRQEKVDALKEQLANGTYQIDSRNIASRLLSEEGGLFV